MSITSQLGRPRGTSICSIDALRRLRLPAALSGYLANFPGASVFVTTLQPGILRIYPESTWLRNESILESETELADVAEDIHFLANVNGFTGAVDKYGRIRLSTGLYETFGPAGQPLISMVFGEMVMVLTRVAYERVLERASEKRDEKLSSLRRRGLR